MADTKIHTKLRSDELSCPSCVPKIEGVDRTWGSSSVIWPVLR